MRTVVVGGQTVHFEAPEAGRYHAPLLLLPGMFQSFLCWRAVTSALAHRGWEVYCLARTMPDEDGERLVTEDDGWERAREKVLEVAGRLGDKTIVLGADLGAALALATAAEIAPLAMALFAPSRPQALAEAHRRSLGMLGRRRGPKAGSPLAVPPNLARDAPFEQFTVPEPGRLVSELPEVAPPPACGIPRIVFAPEGDPLVDRDEATAFAGEQGARLAPTTLAGRWWPSDPGTVGDEIHRFLILTLGDRIVEFPDEILAD